MSEKKKRKQISNETKLDIVLNKNNLKPSELAVASCLAPSTICTIVANKDKILQYFEQNKIDETSKRIHHSNFNNIEDAIMMWFNQTILTKNITLTSTKIR
jgi:hypothetical protein